MATSGKLMKPMGSHPQGWKKKNQCLFMHIHKTFSDSAAPKVHSGCIHFMN